MKPLAGVFRQGLQQRYDAAFAQCMVVLGNQLPGTGAAYRRVPRAPPAPV